MYRTLSERVRPAASRSAASERLTVACEQRLRRVEKPRPAVRSGWSSSSQWGSPDSASCSAEAYVPSLRVFGERAIESDLADERAQRFVN